MFLFIVYYFFQPHTIIVFNDYKTQIRNMIIS